MEHSPTRIKRRESTRLNRGVASPINYPYVSSIFQYTWRPSRAPTWPRGLPATWRAPCDSCVGHTRPATWPQCHVITARWTRAPRRPARHVGPLATSALPGPTRHVSRRSPRQPQVISPPFFVILTKKFLKKSIKNQIKIGENGINFRNSYFSKYNSFLIQIFSIGSQILFFLISCQLKYI